MRPSARISSPDRALWSGLQVHGISNGSGASRFIVRLLVGSAIGTHRPVPVSILPFRFAFFQYLAPLCPRRLRTSRAASAAWTIGPTPRQPTPSGDILRGVFRFWHLTDTEHERLNGGHRRVIAASLPPADAG